MPIDEELLAAFGQVLRAARDRAGLTQEQLAHQSGLSLPYISQIESGRRNVSLTTIFQLAQGLGAAPDALIKRTERLTSR